ncbi:hypothetical protein ACFLU0_00515 [Chloroflexota bacterium]
MGWGYHSFSDIVDNFGYGYGVGTFIGPTWVQYNVTWTPPSNWPAGTYQVTIQAWGDTSDSLIGSAPLVLATYAPPPPEEPGITDVSDIVNEDGTFTEDVTAESEDGNVAISIDEGVIGLTEEGEPLSEIWIIPIEEEAEIPPPEGGHIIAVSYDAGPDGATFSEPITLTITYNPDDLPEGVSEEDLVIAVWDEDADPPQWVELPSVVDTENNTVTVTLNHFTIFAIIAPPVVGEEEVVPPVEEEEEEEVIPPVEEEEEEVVTPPVEGEEEEEEEEEVVTPPVEEGEEGLAWWIWLIIGLGSATVIGLLIYFLRWRRRY